VNFKYIGEAVALLGIAYSIMRWIGRNVADADVPSSTLAGIDVSHGTGRRLRVAERRTPSPTPPVAPAVPSPVPDPGMLDGAAAMFGLTRTDLERMDPRQRTLLLDGYRAARDAQRRGDDPGGDTR
jgi:hypothetical protein